MGSISVAERNKMLDAVAGRADYTAPADFYAKLYIGDPGATGVTNAAAETTRQIVAMGAAASAGAISSTAATVWTNVSTAETITHIGFWSASTAGFFLGSDDLPTAKVLGVGDTLTIPSGDIDLTIT